MYFVFYLLGFISYINFEIRDSHQKQASSLSSLPGFVYLLVLCLPNVFIGYSVDGRSKNDKIGYSYSILYELE